NRLRAARARSARNGRTDALQARTHLRLRSNAQRRLDVVGEGATERLLLHANALTTRTPPAPLVYGILRAIVSRNPSDPGGSVRRPPRIAFVGAGGAARGIAHLGVLKACEEL